MNEYGVKLRRINEIEGKIEKNWTDLEFKKRKFFAKMNLERSYEVKD